MNCFQDVGYPPNHRELVTDSNHRYSKAGLQKRKGTMAEMKRARCAIGQRSKSPIVGGQIVLSWHGIQELNSRRLHGKDKRQCGF